MMFFDQIDEEDQDLIEWFLLEKGYQIFELQCDHDRHDLTLRNEHVDDNLLIELYRLIKRNKRKR